MQWKEVKEEWKKLDKKRKCETVANICGTLAATILIILGCNQMCDYWDMIPSDHKYAIGGAFIASTGYFVFWWLCWKYDRGRFDRIEERIEKLEGSNEDQ